MKSCNRCKKFDKLEQYCKEFELKISDTLTATYCKGYRSRTREAIKKKVKCSDCRNMNKHNYCYEKRICFSDEDKYKTRQCIKHISKSSKHSYKKKLV